MHLTIYLFLDTDLLKKYFERIFFLRINRFMNLSSTKLVSLPVKTAMVKMQK